MLILSRRAGESINLGDDIKVTVLSIKGRQVKLGIEVPEEVPVYREEIYVQVQESNKLAALAREEDFLAAADLWTKKD